MLMSYEDFFAEWLATIPEDTTWTLEDVEKAYDTYIRGTSD